MVRYVGATRRDPPAAGTPVGLDASS
ncbi:MAG: hypothetical protein QOE62_682, partial [Actinomycetota bacterium]|nr:hypothetical protein [Actinomycetota bacterium]